MEHWYFPLLIQTLLILDLLHAILHFLVAEEEEYPKMNETHYVKAKYDFTF